MDKDELVMATAKQRNFRDELLAVNKCQEGDPIWLAATLAEYGLSNDLVLRICGAVGSAPKAKKPGKRLLAGLEFAKRYRTRPGEKKVVAQELSADYQRQGKKLSPKSAENVYDELQERVKPMGITMDDLHQLLDRLKDPTLPA